MSRLVPIWKILISLIFNEHIFLEMLSRINIFLFSNMISLVILFEFFLNFYFFFKNIGLLYLIGLYCDLCVVLQFRVGHPFIGWSDILFGELVSGPS